MNRMIRRTGFVSLGVAISLAGCGLNPQNADVDMNVTLPEAKLTIYGDAIRNLGMMSEIYNRASLNVMSKDISDNTGTSIATKGEIPRDITEIVKSTLNGIGGNVTFIPYDPAFIQNNVVAGYDINAENFIKPDVVVSGGITEFDRGLVTKGDTSDAEATVGEYGFSFEDQNKASLAQVTLDFNLIDFKTMAGIPRIQAVNGIKLHKSVKDDSMAFTIKSVTFGAKGTIKKIQGRHAAIRLLVQLSMVQLVGRYQKVPYWRLILGGQRDNVVIDMVTADFYDMSEIEKIATMQSYLYLYGYSVALTGRMDQQTIAALKQFSNDKGQTATGVNEETYLALFENIPVDHKTNHRRKTMPAFSGYEQAQNVSTSTQYETSTSQYVAQTASANKYVETKGNIDLWTNKNFYNIGEQMIISFTVDKPMFVRLVVINSQGERSTLFPNPYQSDNYCKPGVTYQIPPNNADFALDIGGPSGTDKIRAIASSNSIPSASMVFTARGEFDKSTASLYPVRATADIVIH